MQLDWWSSIGMCEREMNICLSILSLYVPSTRGRVRLESRDSLTWLPIMYNVLICIEMPNRQQQIRSTLFHPRTDQLDTDFHGRTEDFLIKWKKMPFHIAFTDKHLRLWEYLGTIDKKANTAKSERNFKITLTWDWRSSCGGLAGSRPGRNHQLKLASERIYNSCNRWSDSSTGYSQ